MIEFKITNRFSYKVQFTAEIDCAPNASDAQKIGLAVKWALRNRVDLTGANLFGANLHGADLRDADLRYVYLTKADLTDANLRGADLCHADLSGSDLSGADLRYADLRYAERDGALLSDRVLAPGGPTTLVD